MVRDARILVQKVTGRSLDQAGFCHPSEDWKTPSVDQAVNGYLFRIREA